MSDHLEKLIALAIDEDLAGGVDITSIATIPAEQESIAQIVNRSAGVIAGIPVAVEVLRYVGIIDISFALHDGQYAPAGTVILEARGKHKRVVAG